MECKQHCLYQKPLVDNERLCDICKKYSDEVLAPYFAYLIRLYFNEYLKKNKHNDLYANGVKHGMLVSMATVQGQNSDNMIEGVSE